MLLEYFVIVSGSPALIATLVLLVIGEFRVSEYAYVSMAWLVRGEVGRRRSFVVVTSGADFIVEALLAFVSSTSRDGFGLADVAPEKRVWGERLGDELNVVTFQVISGRLSGEKAFLAERNVSRAIRAFESTANDGKGVATEAAVAMNGKPTGDLRRLNCDKCMRRCMCVFQLVWDNSLVVARLAEVKIGTNAASESNAPKWVRTASIALVIVVESLFVKAILQLVVIFQGFV